MIPRISKAIITLALTSLLIGHAQAEQTCLTINQEINNLEQVIEQGRDRYSQQASDLSYFDYSTATNYQDYIDFTRQQIAQRNPKADLPCPITNFVTSELIKQQTLSQPVTVKDLIAPFQLNADPDKAILLIHGLTDSPFHLHDLAQHYYQQGFTIRSLLLPGHGTAPNDLLDVSYKQWQQATDFAIEQTIKDFNTVYLGGFSTGGALILNHYQQQASSNPQLNTVKGIFLWAPASQAKSKLAWLASIIDWIPFVDWIDLDMDLDIGKYESFTYNAAAQVHCLMAKLNLAEDFNIKVPLFVVTSEVDQTIDTESTLTLLNNISSALPSGMTNTLVYYGDTQAAQQQLSDKIKVLSPELADKCQQAGCERIIEVAHTGITNAINNTYYGLNGHYRNCGHYLNDLAKYNACRTNSDNQLAEKQAHLVEQNNIVQRITFNPYFAHMLQQIDVFIQQTIK